MRTRYIAVACIASFLPSCDRPPKGELLDRNFTHPGEKPAPESPQGTSNGQAPDDPGKNASAHDTKPDPAPGGGLPPSSTPPAGAGGQAAGSTSGGSTTAPTAGGSRNAPAAPEKKN
ncbi:hypothetical protein [Luteolibacter sp. Populi]|uniref:hypothetical protein n=1 Tax=Luteolibacter sp. Populi TaxID=3230487 RepID=UPI0034674160